MPNLSRGGIAYNLSESPYRCNVLYSIGGVQSGITFVFSSGLYLRKFNEQLHRNRKTINLSLSNRFGFTIENDVLCDVRLYRGIEKRGFLIYQNGERFECPESLRLDGSSLTETN